MKLYEAIFTPGATSVSFTNLTQRRREVGLQNSAVFAVI